MESNINWQQRYNELQEVCMKERAALQAKCERYEKALRDIESFPDNQWHGKAVRKIANEALFGEGEKEEGC